MFEHYGAFVCELKELIICQICTENMFDPQTISCGHTYCSSCVESLCSQVQPQCPVCRNTFKRSEKIGNYVLKSIVELFSRYEPPTLSSTMHEAFEQAFELSPSPIVSDQNISRMSLTSIIPKKTKKQSEKNSVTSLARDVLVEGLRKNVTVKNEPLTEKTKKAFDFFESCKEPIVTTSSSRQDIVNFADKFVGSTPIFQPFLNENTMVYDYCAQKNQQLSSCQLASNSIPNNYEEEETDEFIYQNEDVIERTIVSLSNNMKQIYQDNNGPMESKNIIEDNSALTYLLAIGGINNPLNFHVSQQDALANKRYTVGECKPRKWSYCPANSPCFQCVCYIIIFLKTKGTGRHREKCVWTELALQGYYDILS